MKMNLNNVNEKKIVIFGTGIDGLRCKDVLYKQYQLSPEYFVVNNCQQTNFAGFSVQECDKQNIGEHFVLVATKEATYPMIKKQLCDMGYIEFEHFIFYEWMFKKLVLLHGNCHLDVIEEYLRSSRNFLEKYSIYPNPRICMNDSKTILTTVLQNIDLWIHEDIQDNNGYSYYLSDNYLRNQMQETVEEITIPHLFGAGKAFFPHSEVNRNNASLSNGKDKNGMFPYADLLIEQCVEKGLSADETVQFCMGENCIIEKDILENFNYFMDKIQQREKSWDIKIYDFIVRNYKVKKLFYDMGHPTNVILEYIAYEILDRLEIKDLLSADIRLDYHEVPVYPAICKVLGLEWRDEKIRTSSEAKRIATEMDVEEYIKEYLYWCHQM